MQPRKRISRAFKVIEALEKLASVEEPPSDWIAELPPYLRHLVEENLDDAFAWVSELDSERRPRKTT